MLLCIGSIRRTARLAVACDAANRRNARKSTGPVTDSGKAAASQNALRHGLTARQIASTDERGADFADFAAALHRDLAPEGEVEEQLAEQVIVAAWRLRRAARRGPTAA